MFGQSGQKQYICGMEVKSITLHNGKAIPLAASSENDTYRFYRCENYGDAVSLHITLTDIGNECAVGEDTRGWYVRVKKQ